MQRALMPPALGAQSLTIGGPGKCQDFKNTYHKEGG